MTVALIIKELRQHWLAFLLATGLTGVGTVVLAASTAFQNAGSTFDTLQRFLSSFFVIMTLVICNRLVVVEYQSKTQLFLEGLPISRVRMILVKYLFGFFLLMTMVTVVFASVTLLCMRNEQLTLRFVLIVAACTYSYSWCVYSCFFVMGFFGRYRIPMYLLTILGVFALDTLTTLELARFGPFALLNFRFGYERVDWPLQALLVTLLLATTFVFLTFVLSSFREGTIATLLAEKMSHREKMLVTIILFGFLISVSVFDEKITKQPFDLPDGLVARVDDVTVKVSVGASPEKERGRRLAQLMAGELASLKAYLQIRELPPIFIVQRRDMDADRYERGVLEGAEGLLVRTNFLNDEWQRERFQSWLVRELLILASAERVKLEPNMWVLDGFSLYWTCRDSDSTPVDYAKLELRAAYGSKLGFSADNAANWLTYRERVGADIASAVAWHGLISLRRMKGEAACRAFLQAMLDCGVPGDVRGVWHEWQNPLSELIVRETELPYEKFVALWSGDLRTLELARENDLALVPKMAGTVSFKSISATTRVVHFEFTSDPAPSRFTFLHAKLTPFDEEVPASAIHREELQYDNDRRSDLPGTYARGTRFYATFAVRVERLGCEIISGWTRKEMR